MKRRFFWKGKAFLWVNTEMLQSRHRFSTEERTCMLIPVLYRCNAGSLSLSRRSDSDPWTWNLRRFCMGWWWRVLYCLQILSGSRTSWTWECLFSWKKNCFGHWKCFHVVTWLSCLFRLLAALASLMMAAFSESLWANPERSSCKDHEVWREF